MTPQVIAVGNCYIIIVKREGNRVYAWGTDQSGNEVLHFGTADMVRDASGVRTYQFKETAERALRPLLLEIVQGRHPEATIVRGWDFAGPGPAIYGWWAKGPCSNQFLGKNLSEIAM